MFLSHRASRFTFFSFAFLLIAAAISVVGARGARAEALTCAQIKDGVAIYNEPVRTKLNDYFTGKKHKLLINYLTILGVSSVYTDDEGCAIILTLDAKIDRKLRRDAVGTITLRVQASANRVSETALDVSFSQPHITAISLSRTLKATEKVYETFANQLLQNDTVTIRVDL